MPKEFEASIWTPNNPLIRGIEIVSKASGSYITLYYPLELGKRANYLPLYDERSPLRVNSLELAERPILESEQSHHDQYHPAPEKVQRDINGHTHLKRKHLGPFTQQEVHDFICKFIELQKNGLLRQAQQLNFINSQFSLYMRALFFHEHDNTEQAFLNTDDFKSLSQQLPSFWQPPLCKMPSPGVNEHIRLLVDEAYQDNRVNTLLLFTIMFVYLRKPFIHMLSAITSYFSADTPEANIPRANQENRLSQS